MKKLTLQLAVLFCATSLYAQWIPVNNGLPDYPPTALTAWVDTMVVSTYGGGIYLTYDNGENWSEMPGTLPNLFVNRIEYGGGQFDPIGVATDGGPFICVNGGYIDCNGSGLTNNAINWWSAGYGGIVIDAVAGTKGDGVFAAEYTSPFIYDWAPANPGLAGDALYINDGLVGEGLALLATNSGFYKAIDDETEWTAKNTGLSGEALKINKIGYLGTIILIATDGGLYYTLDFAENWDVVIQDEKLNIVFYLNTDISPTGFMCYALGENGFYTEDFENWIQLDFGGIEGEVTAASADQTNLYIGFTIDGKDGKLNGGMYRRPLEEFLVGIENNNHVSAGTLLEQNFPNPFKKSTSIRYHLSQPVFLCLKVYDYLGSEVKTLINKEQSSGDYNISFNADNLPAGMYIYKLQVGNQKVITKRMMIIQ